MGRANKKIEQEAVATIRDLAINHTLLDPQISENDKSVSWDGSIDLYSNTSLKKEYFEGTAKVQVKGHDYINKKRSYDGTRNISIDLADLNNYCKEQGCLYFVVYMSGNEKQIYYASLYPSRCLAYREKAIKNKNKNQVPVRFSLLDNTEESLYNVVRQYVYECRIQGSTINPLTHNFIKMGDKSSFVRLQELSFNSAYSHDIVENLKEMKNGNICLYAKVADEQYSRPVYIEDDSKLMVSYKIEGPVSICNKQFYEKYSVINDSDGNRIVKFSPSLSLNITTSKIEFTPRNDLNGVYRDSAFLHGILQNGGFYVNDKYIDIILDDVPEKDRQIIEKNSIIYHYFDLLGLLETDFSQLTDMDYKDIAKLLLTDTRIRQDLIKESYFRFNWVFRNKCYPIVVYNHNGIFEAKDARDIDGKFFLGTKDGETCIIPFFVGDPHDQLAMYLSDDDEFICKAIENCEIKECALDSILSSALEWIKAYDKTSKLACLKYAEMLIDKYANMLGDDIYLLNKKQIKYRRIGLDEMDLQEIRKINTEDNGIIFGQYVLLGEWDNARKCFEMLPEEKKNLYMKFPIYTLFQKMIPA